MLKTVKFISSKLTHSPRFNLGFIHSLVHLMRTTLNKIRWEENQQFTSLETRSSNVPKSAEQATQVFLEVQKEVSLSEQKRMQRIDEILGTRTHFHEGKIFQERIDSDHIMQIEQLKKQNPEIKREHLNWLNPQADIKLKFKNKRKYLNAISQIANYPQHNPGNYDLSNQIDQNTIEFLAKQTAYTTICLKPVELTAKSLQEQSLFLAPEPPFETKHFSYFRPQFSMQLLRVPKSLYHPQLLRNQVSIDVLGSQVEQIISLDEIYKSLKEYDNDQRVHEYLRKIQNNRVQCLFSDISFDEKEEKVAITVDILDNNEEFCLLVKNIKGSTQLLRPIFNMRGPVTFSRDGKKIFFIQRSAEGGWIEIVSRPFQSFIAGGQIILPEDEGIIYRSSPEKELRICKNHSNQLLINLSDYGRKYTSQLYGVIPRNENSYDLISIDEDGSCEYYAQICPKGLILCKKRKVQSGQLKYGNNPFYIQSIELIPFKEHLQIHQQKIGIKDLLPGVSQTVTSPGIQQLDFEKKRCIFIPDNNQYITQVEVRITHLIITINYASIYDRAQLYFLPLKESSHPHSLILKGGSQLKLQTKSYKYQSQEVCFIQPLGMMHTIHTYSIWKKELKMQERQAFRYHYQTIVIQESEVPFQLHFHCKNLYLEEGNLPVVLVLTGKGQGIDQQVLRQFLEKGTGVVHFCGRGTLTKDLQHYLAGSRHNFANMLDDIKATVQFIGNKMSRNISLYCKGEIPSLVGLWFNIYFPYLFNSSVIHNGLYDLSDEVQVSKFIDFFGKQVSKDIQGFQFKKFNIFQHQFKNLRSSSKSTQCDEEKEVQIGFIENMIISSDPLHRIHSRKLVKRLRQNILLPYPTVFLKEYDDPYSTDLHNLSFIFSKIRQRLEKQLNELPEEDEEEN